MSKKVNVVVSLKSQGQQTVKSESFRQSKKSIGPDPTFLTVLSDFFVYTVSDLFFFLLFRVVSLCFLMLTFICLCYVFIFIYVYCIF